MPVVTDAQCRALRPGAKRYRVSLGGSLFLAVHPSARKTWEFRYKRGGRVAAVVLGEYPELGLRKARQARDKVKAMLANGLDPVKQKAIAKHEQAAQLERLKSERAQARAEKSRKGATFERIALEWLEHNRRLWTEQHVRQIRQSLSDHAFAELGAMPIDAIGTREVLAVLDTMLAAGKLETAARVKQRISAIFEYAALRHHVSADPVSLIRREFSKRLRLARKLQPVQNIVCVPTSEAPALLRALRAYEAPAGTLVRFIALTACRTGEARHATRAEIDIEGATWNITASRMKARKAHAIPLSRQALEVLRSLLITSGGAAADFIFPHPRIRERPASENAVLYVLAALGYKNRMTGHGFRTLFSTIANESGLWRKEVIEVALAHVESDDVRAAYMRSDFLEERRRLMQWWADELDRLEAGTPAKVRAIRR
jgi:integrase